jgi:hypothetical protein
MTKRCCLCNKALPENESNNPAPLPGEECCDNCNEATVIPVRIFLEGINVGAMILRPDWEILIVRPTNIADFQFDIGELQNMVGGNIKTYPASDVTYMRKYSKKFCFIVNGEGQSLKLKLNGLAKAMFHEQVYGNLVIVNKTAMRGINYGT